MMKPLFATLCLVLSLCIQSIAYSESYLRTGKVEVGKSNAFELSRNERGIIKLSGNDYFVIEVVESDREDTSKTVTETCTLIWTRLNGNEATSGQVAAYIKYKKEKISEREFKVSRMAGSDRIVLGNEYSIQWSYASTGKVYLYPKHEAQFVTSKIVQ